MPGNLGSTLIKRCYIFQETILLFYAIADILQRVGARWSVKEDHWKLISISVLLSVVTLANIILLFSLAFYNNILSTSKKGLKKQLLRWIPVAIFIASLYSVIVFPINKMHILFSESYVCCWALVLITFVTIITDFSVLIYSCAGYNKSDDEEYYIEGSFSKDVGIGWKILRRLYIFSEVGFILGILIDILMKMSARWPIEKDQKLIITIFSFLGIYFFDLIISFIIYVRVWSSKIDAQKRINFERGICIFNCLLSLTIYFILWTPKNPMHVLFQHAHSMSFSLTMLNLHCLFKLVKNKIWETVTGFKSGVQMTR